MQTYTQTFAGVTTWELYVPGKYLAIIACTNAVNVRLYKGGKLLDYGSIQSINAGLEIGGFGMGVDFDRVQIDTTAADTISIGIGNGTARYNRGNANVTVAQNKATQSASFANTAKTVTNATGQLVAANTARQYLAIQNKDASGTIWINFGAGAATTANGLRIVPGGNAEFADVVPTGAIQAIGDLANNANIVVVEG